MNNKFLSILFLFVLISNVFSINVIDNQKSIDIITTTTKTPTPSETKNIYLILDTIGQGQIIETVDLITGRTISTTTFDTNYKTQDVITVLNETNLLVSAYFEKTQSILNFDLQNSKFEVVHTFTNKFENNQYISTCLLINNTIYLPIKNVTYPDSVITVLSYNMDTSIVSSVDFKVTSYDPNEGFEPSIVYDSNNDLMYIYYSNENNDLSVLEYKLSDPLNSQKLYQFIDNLDSGFYGVGTSVFGPNGQLFMGYEDNAMDFNFGVIDLKNKEFKQTFTFEYEVPAGGGYNGQQYLISQDNQQLVLTSHNDDATITIDIFQFNNHYNRNTYTIPDTYTERGIIFLYFYLPSQ